MSNHIFEKFEEVEESIRINAPKIVYKYREDWNEKYHKELVTEQSAWFAAPRYLNDPYDIRIPVKFDFSEIENPIFFEKLKSYFIDNNSSKHFTESLLNQICEKKLNEIRKDPKEYFERNYQSIREGNIYDRVGLFSCTSDGLNETMWAHYGKNQKGFAIGFNTLELSRDLNCSFGKVKYSDEIPLYSFINDNSDIDFDNHFLKSKKWEYENEFRFYTLGIDENISRKKQFSKSSVAEFILGSNFPKETLSEIINTIKTLYNNEMPIYQTKSKLSSFGLDKIRIN